MADLDRAITVRLLSVIASREWHERATAKRLRADENKAAYAPLFDRAAGFWLKLGLLVESGRNPDRDQAMATAYLRESIERDVMAETKRAADTRRNTVTTPGAPS
jgi:hypothetical protein